MLLERLRIVQVLTMIQEFKKRAKRLTELLGQSQTEVHPGTLKINLLDYNTTKAESRSKLIAAQISGLQQRASQLSSYSSTPENAKIIAEIQFVSNTLTMKDAGKTLASLRHVQLLADRIANPPGFAITLKPRALPEAIREEVQADLEEIGTCMSSGCYRSAAILCGRILETALHRKYYEVTGVDILEKNPGIGLGNLIAKLVEKNVSFDPGLTQQIHLINQVRIFSVHKKQEAFYPSRAQAEAITLYTMDALEKLFKKNV